MSDITICLQKRNNGLHPSLNWWMRRQAVRRISTELRQAILDAVGLVAAVEWAAGEFAARTGTKCQLDLAQGDIVIDEERATALFRIFQETLTNAAHHAERN